MKAATELICNICFRAPEAGDIAERLGAELLGFAEGALDYKEKGQPVTQTNKT